MYLIKCFSLIVKVCVPPAHVITVMYLQAASSQLVMVTPETGYRACRSAYHHGLVSARVELQLLAPSTARLAVAPSQVLLWLAWTGSGAESWLIFLITQSVQRGERWVLLLCENTNLDPNGIHSDPIGLVYLFRIRMRFDDVEKFIFSWSIIRKNQILEVMVKKCFPSTPWCVPFQPLFELMPTCSQDISFIDSNRQEQITFNDF